MERAGRVSRASGSSDRDAALHDVRKAAKRLRYAAEAAAEVLGPRAVRLAAVSEAVQEALGEHHDSVVARDLLQSLGSDDPGQPDGTAVLDRLHDREAACASAAEQSLLEAWAELPRRHRARWLTGGGAPGGRPARLSAP
jgi:CHAD domain-containing protein